MAKAFNRIARVGTKKALDSPRVCRVGVTSHLTSVRRARVGLSSQVGFVKTSRTKLFTPYGYVSFVENTSPYALDMVATGQTVENVDPDLGYNVSAADAGYITPLVTYQLVLTVLAGTYQEALTLDLTPYLETWEFKWPWHGKATWTGTFVDHSRASGVGTNSSVMDSTTDPQAFIASAPSLFAFLDKHYLRCNNLSLDRWLRMTYTIDGIKYLSPKLIPGSPSFDGEVMTWHGEDCTQFMEQPKQDMPDIDINGGSPMNAQAAFTQIMNAKGFGAAGTSIPITGGTIPLNNPFYMGFDDYPIALLRREGIPLSWMDTLTSRDQAGRFFNGDTWTFPKPAWYANPIATYIDYEHIVALNLLEDLSNLKNRQRVNQTKSGGGNIGSDMCTGTSCPGIRHMSFDVPSRQITLLWNAAGRLYNFVYFDAAGRPTSPDPQGNMYDGFVPVKSCLFTYEPTFAGVFTGTGLGLGLTTANIPPDPFYQIDAMGGGVHTATTGQPSQVFDDLPSQVAHGLHEEDSAIDAGLFQNVTDLIIYGNNKIQASTQRVYHSSLTTPFFNPGLLPGSTIKVIDLRTGQAVGVLWFVEEITHMLDKDGHFEMKLDLRRGLLNGQNPAIATGWL